jgi:hypothetical protein
MAAPIRSYRDYPNNSWVFLMHDNPRMMRLARALRSVGVLPRGFGDNLLAEDAQQAARSDEASAA